MPEPVVLLVLADVENDRPLPELVAEARYIRETFEPPNADQRHADVKEMFNPSLDDVVTRLGQRWHRDRIQIFHFGGHASAVSLLLADLQGQPATTHAKGLAHLLGMQQGLVLVVLNGCSTLAQVEGLRNAGVGAVVATTRAIRDEVGAYFAKRFYEELISLPLEQAFERATATVKASRGDNLRELVDDAEDFEQEWSESMPWVLRCTEELKSWRFGTMPEPEPEPKPTANGQADPHTLADQLANILYDADMSRMVLSRIGFPMQRIPAFRTPMTFWHDVTTMLSNGVLEDGLQRLIDEVARMYPGNEFFQSRARAR